MDSNRLKISMETFDNYLRYMEENDCLKSSIESYYLVLKKFYDFLPEDKIITADTSRQWQQYLIEQGYANRTVINRVRVLNGLLKFLGKRQWQCDNTLSLVDSEQPELTRNEYLRLLQTAKTLNKERTYLIIKTLCCVGLRVHELRYVSVEDVKNGQVIVSQRSQPDKVLSIPKALQAELLSYAERNSIISGSIFITRNGKRLNRSNIWHDIQVVCAKAEVPEEKANPRCLWKLHQSTYEEIEDNIAVLVRQAYDRMLENKELTIGWKQREFKTVTGA